VLKTADREVRGFESLRLRQFFVILKSVLFVWLVERSGG
ncbi:MAG: hypothetical protein ACI9MC_000288, partial [Kiritimatiellia bacterium]